MKGMQKPERTNVALLAAEFIANLFERPFALERALKGLSSSYYPVRIRAITTLGKLKNPKAVPKLISLLGEPSETPRIAAAQALREINSRHPLSIKYVEQIVGMLKDERLEARIGAAHALGEIPIFADFPKGDVERNRQCAIAERKLRIIVPALLSSMSDENGLLADVSAVSLASINSYYPLPNHYVERIIGFLRNGNPQERRRAAKYFQISGDARAVPDLMVLLKDGEAHRGRASFFAHYKKGTEEGQMFKAAKDALWVIASKLQNSRNYTLIFYPFIVLARNGFLDLRTVADTFLSEELKSGSVLLFQLEEMKMRNADNVVLIKLFFENSNRKLRHAIVNALKEMPPSIPRLMEFLVERISALVDVGEGAEAKELAYFYIVCKRALSGREQDSIFLQNLDETNLQRLLAEIGLAVTGQRDKAMREMDMRAVLDNAYGVFSGKDSPSRAFARRFRSPPRRGRVYSARAVA